MAIQYDKLYEGQGKKTFTLACGMISTTSIYFKDAALLVKVEAEGEVFSTMLQGNCRHLALLKDKTAVIMR